MSVAPISDVTIPRATRRVAVRAIGPRLWWLLIAIFVMLAVLGANALYLGGVTALEWWTGRTYQNWFYQYMFLGHLGLGLLFIPPFVVFASIHIWNTRHRKNRRAIRAGYALFVASLVVLGSGVLLMRVAGFDLRQPVARTLVYWLHVVSPLVAGWLYWLHRLVGPRIRWKAGLGYLGVVGATVGLMLVIQMQDPRQWNAQGPASGEKYFEPSLARTATGDFISADALMNNEYCLQCHQDAYKGWFHSAHHFSSFNNPAYRASVRETRDVLMKREQTVQASRWCAGCHDPVPFFSGAFDDPQFDDLQHPTSQAGITCVSCHAITHVNSTRGNADYTIEEPMHYPFATSDDPRLQWLNAQLIKAKPEFHKKTFLKDFHRSAEFCSTCHKVSLPVELNRYRDFLRGQNHYDSYLLSGVSGHGARSFYYPEQAKTNCSQCHMPFQPSEDFGAKPVPSKEGLHIHNHLFPAANTGLAWLLDAPEVILAHQQFLAETMRVDIFGLREGTSVGGTLTAPLRPHVPVLKPGSDYVLETVIRTLKLGHHFTQGTVDSNEIWLDVTVTSGDRVIGRSGSMDELKAVDPWSHFVNVFLVDRDGNRINRRNPQDIFVPVYNHQIPPGAGQAVHYGFAVPDDVTEPITVDVKLQYRKFDQEYMTYVAKQTEKDGRPVRGHTPGQPYINELPITTLAQDRLTFPVAGIVDAVANPTSPIPEWQRWNDYGIGLLLTGKAQLRQASEAFAAVEQLGRYDGPLNLARALYVEGRLDEAAEALTRAAAHSDPPAPPWTMAWLSGQINREQGRLEAAEANFRSVLESSTPDMQARGFDFSQDYEVINLLGQTLFDRARQLRGTSQTTERNALLQAAIDTFRRTLVLDAENATAHYNLALLHERLGQNEDAERHRRAHARYNPDDNARDRALAAARKKYPAADHAAEAMTIYPLQRE